METSGGIHADSGHDRDMEQNLSAFTAVLGHTFEPWMTTYSVLCLREDLGITVSRRIAGTTIQ